MIILIGGEKGGSGKSALAQNISVSLAIRGKRVKIVDADPQGTTEDWAEDRAAASPNATQVSHVHMTGNIRDTLIELDSQYDFIIVDVGGKDSKPLRSAMTCAHKMLIPLRPKRRDLKTLDHMSELVELARTMNPNMWVRAVITQAPPLPTQAQRILDAKGICETFGIQALNAVTFARNIYDDCDENGLSVFESNDDKAKAEIEAIVSEMGI